MQVQKNKGKIRAGKPQVQFVLLNGSVRMAQMSWGKSGKDLRRFISSQLSDELPPEKMAIFYKGTRVASDMKLSKLQVIQNQPIVIHQKKIPAEDICQKKKPKPTLTDVFTGLPGGVLLKMPCGHGIGSDSMMRFLRREIIQFNKTTLMCPYSLSRVAKCNKQWSFQVCQRVGVLTKSQKSEFLEGLQRNKWKNNQTLLGRFGAQTQTKTATSAFSTSIPVLIQNVTRTNTLTTKTPAITPIQIQKKTDYLKLWSLVSRLLQIIIVLESGEERVVKFYSSTTGQQLKEYIYKYISKSLQPACMSLYYVGIKIENHTKLSDINIIVGTQLKIIQTKAHISELTDVIVDIQGIDMISLERGVAKMTCGHKIGRDTMVSFIRSLISTNKFEIRCPYPDGNGMICMAIWSFKDCRKIGVFTKEESEEFEKGLSMNQMKEFTKKCPNPLCKEQICKVGLKTNRVVCPSCKYGDFCYLCLKPWRGNQISCGNEECKFLGNFLTTCQWSRKFELYPKGTKSAQTYLTPKYRACPSCSLVIEHHDACKHMTCKNCAKKFCWVCLGVVLPNGLWQCGSFNDYCGKVAQAQKLIFN